MRRNAVGYLGLLGFLGLLGLITGNPGYYGFLGFFGFLAALWGRGSDERVDNNVNRACRNAFIFAMVASASFISYIGILRASEILSIAFSVAFAGSLILFVASFIYYNESGS